MKWKVIFDPEYARNKDLLLSGLIGFTLFGFILRLEAMLIVLGFFCLYLLLTILYDAIMRRKLILSNEKTSLRMFQGEMDVLMFTFENKSLLPFINGIFEFQIGKEIDILEHKVVKMKITNKVAIPITLKEKGKTEFKIPLEGIRRGVTRITSISCIFPHLINFNQVRMEYMAFYNYEVIIYPKPLIVKNIDNLFTVSPGNKRSQYSPFDDEMSIKSIRDYTYSDSFEQINWNATAKMQRLQTNVHEKVMDMSLVLVVNLYPVHGWKTEDYPKMIEKYLSYTTYLCQYAAKQGIPFSIHINARTLGRYTYYYLPEGEGIPHYTQALELLARVPRQPMVFPFQHMLHHVTQQTTTDKTVIFLGGMSVAEHNFLAKQNRYGKRYVVKEYEEEATLEDYDKGVVVYAT
ncbi:DUF58 domain-containing protein [Virgibacillus soli]|uniref:DUF58 domain-containing protein n=1 Tax=Paracerasibacillus soli TaxID=480284 RepID=A0ABU5CRH0_9BACI|nr:DUF58 domain-containing protein [Virgibacillus soli]MDY0408830.1 DUF58 domain-containing protein [Virgibacillus soli]